MRKGDFIQARRANAVADRGVREKKREAGEDGQWSGTLIMAGSSMRPLGVVMCLLAAAAPHALMAQLPAVGPAYRAKFVCGDRPPSNDFDAVAPGRYYTALNIYNPSADSVIVRTWIATTAPGFVPGTRVAGPTVTIPSRLAAEMDCGEILRASERHFLKGFIEIRATRPVLVIGVYTVADSVRAVSIDVERIP